MIVVLDFGSQFTQLIARRLREKAFYSEVYPFDWPFLETALGSGEVSGVILSGGPASVYQSEAPRAQPCLFKQHVPLLGICYGLQLIVHHFGGAVCPATRREYGLARLAIGNDKTAQQLFGDSAIGAGHEQQVWMSHTDRIDSMPAGFVSIGSTTNTPFAAIADPRRRIFGLQFHPEASQSKDSGPLFAAFAGGICGAPANWNVHTIVDTMSQKITDQIGDRRAIVAVSGGVDSSVAAVLTHRVIGDRLQAVYIDNGLLRAGEQQAVESTLSNKLSIPLTFMDAREAFLADLANVTDPEQKRKRIGTRFIRSFEEVARTLNSPPCLVQGTIYPDVIESSQGSKSTRNIKAHHNVGGLPKDIGFELVEPLRKLFKDEVRQVGTALGLPDELIWRQPFPGPGLAVRCLGEVTLERLDCLRAADRIFTDLLSAAGLLNRPPPVACTAQITADPSIISAAAQAFAVLLPVRSVGVMGDQRSYEEVIALRAVQTSDFMTADWVQLPYSLLAEAATRIVNEVPGVNRVAYDITTKPPGTIEWE